MRYNRNDIIKKNGVSFYRSKIYPNIPIKNSDNYLITSEGDKLTLLANKYYKDQSLWWIIYRANNLSNGSIFPPPGIQLRIPTEINDILNEFENINQL